MINPSLNEQISRAHIVNFHIVISYLQCVPLKLFAH